MNTNESIEGSSFFSFLLSFWNFRVGTTSLPENKFSRRKLLFRLSSLFLKFSGGYNLTARKLKFGRGHPLHQISIFLYLSHHTLPVWSW